jgi:hypothetical protein
VADHGFQQVHRIPAVVLVILERLPDRFPDLDERREVHGRVWPALADRPVEQILVVQVSDGQPAAYQRLSLWPATTVTIIFMPSRSEHRLPPVWADQ